MENKFSCPGITDKPSQDQVSSDPGENNITFSITKCQRTGVRMNYREGSIISELSENVEMHAESDRVAQPNYQISETQD